MKLLDSAVILKNSYYCCRLRTGSIIMSVIDLIAALIGIITVAALYPDKPLFKIPGIQPVRSQLRASVIILMVDVILLLPAAIALLVGVGKRWYQCVFAYVIVSGLVVILSVIATGLMFGYTPWYILLIETLLIIVSWYHWAIVYSYLMTLMAAGDGTSDVSDVSSLGILQRVRF